MGKSFTAKAMSSIRAYAETHGLVFLIYEKMLANRYYQAHKKAEQEGLPAHVYTRSKQDTTAYWDHVQDALADLVRIMLQRCFDEKEYPELYKHCRNLRGEVALLFLQWKYCSISLCAWPRVLRVCVRMSFGFPSAVVGQRSLPPSFVVSFAVSLVPWGPFKILISRTLSSILVHECAFPNVFITIAPAEWRFPLPYFLLSYYMNYAAGCYLIAIHMYLAVQRIIQYFLCSKFGNKWFKVYEYAIKTEYQCRGTPHWHMALWVVSYIGDLEQLRGRIKEMVDSPLFKFLYACFGCSVDIQIGNGRLNYISGYISKDHDAVDVDLGEHTKAGAESPWLCTYRLLSKCTPSIGQVAISNLQLPHFSTSYVEVQVFPLSPLMYKDQLHEEKLSGSAEMYKHYLVAQQQLIELQQPVSQSFLIWHRDKKWDALKRRPEVFGGGQKHKNMTNVVACRYWYELADGYLGQFAATQIPHHKVEDLLPKEYQFIPGLLSCFPVEVFRFPLGDLFCLRPFCLWVPCRFSSSSFSSHLGSSAGCLWVGPVMSSHGHNHTPSCYLIL